MFRAAANVGPATQPLLTYYGLNEAGRAIAAAASSIDPSAGWRLEGHGIHCAAVALRDSLPDITNWAIRQGDDRLMMVTHAYWAPGHQRRCPA
jgi:hypothetical protein